MALRLQLQAASPLIREAKLPAAVIDLVNHPGNVDYLFL